MLLVIRHMGPQLRRPVGFKVSGGIRKLQQAAQYIELADQIMGRDWVKACHFPGLGQVKLVDEITQGQLSG